MICIFTPQVYLKKCLGHHLVLKCYSIRHDIVQLRAYALPHFNPLRPLASPQSHGLAIFLKLGNQLIALLDYIVVLLVLIIRSVSLNDTLSGYSVDSAGDSFSCNEFGKIAMKN